MSTHRVIETAEQLAALKDGAVICSRNDVTLERSEGAWFTPGLMGHRDDGKVLLPARVLLESWAR